MRTSIWSGLLPTWLYNRQRQLPRLRIFELGAVHALDGGANRETVKLAGLAAGARLPEQWGAGADIVDYFDVKADLEALLGLDASAFRYERGEHPALHPGRSAQIVRDGVAIGWLGELHPRIAAALDVADRVILFEIDWLALRAAALPVPQGVAEFPSSRRDLAFVVEESVSAQALLETIRACAGPLLKSAQVFDTYRGPGLAENHKSLAFSLIFQDYSRTLNLGEIDAAAQAICAGVLRDHRGLVRE
jgi:phenylalanyl-tRNA synthetase beta chain